MLFHGREAPTLLGLTSPLARGRMGAMSDPHHVFLLPGMFGFGRLAGYDYFQHLRRALVERFREHGAEVVVEGVSVPSTASIRRRAARVARAVHAGASNDAGPIHFVGHSTGGLDARLLMSPTTYIRDLDPELLAWRDRVSAVVSVNTPHHGTPLAAFFATVSGTRLLYALSLLTVTTLSVGRPGLAALAQLVAALGTVDEVIGLDIKLLDQATKLALRFVGDEGRTEVEEWLGGIREDQGGIIQLMPEAIDIFNAAAEDSDAVRYGCVATSSPPPGPIRFMKKVRSPYAALSATVYTTLYGITSRASSHYPYPTPSPAIEAKLHASIGFPSDSKMNDGVVPLLSMLWGQLVFAGRGDHLDVVGHFTDGRKPADHVDWLTSGADFDRDDFGTMTHAIADFLLESPA